MASKKMKGKKYFKLMLILLVSLFGFFILQRVVLAQTVSLSITPPIYEVMIAPGKQASQSYLLENNGNDTLVSVKLVPFSPSDNLGNVVLDETLNREQLTARDWFSLEKPDILFEEQLSLPGGSSVEYILNIAPHSTAAEGDYYFTLLFETDSGELGGGRGSAVKTKIGSNILLTVSKDGNPLKIAKVSKFKVPQLVDSFGSLVYQVEIENDGNSFFKPNGDITITPTFGGIQLMRLTPFNILASTKRIIPCMVDDVPIECRFERPFLLGIYKAQLRFQIDDEPRYFQTETETLAFPFVLILIIIVFIIMLKVIRRIGKKNKSGKGSDTH
ncbi:hypothetical protein ACFL0F_01805 [Patescibacteria group bacterium]